MIIGIDLGTTNSLAAVQTEKGPVIIPNRLGERLTPSVVSVDEKDQVYVGKTARERMNLYPESGAAFFKRDMGTDRKFKLGRHEFTAEELSSLVLRSLKEDAEAYLHEPVEEAVISVPAYFNDLRRKATKRAGELAGLKVERIISEPTAAAISYGLYHEQKTSRTLVFDLGGGTLDVSILDYDPPILEVCAVAGDNYLGGKDFTDVLMEIFYRKNPQIDRQNLSRKERIALRKAAEKAKMDLSEKAETVIRVRLSENARRKDSIPEDHVPERKTPEGEWITTPVTAQEFEKNCADLYERIVLPVRRAMSDARLKIADLNKIVLVGGATRMPGLRRKIARMFHTFPDTEMNPDEAVALGAAIEGAMKERQTSVREVILTDVCPFTLGTEVAVELEDGTRESGHYAPILERNTVIPASRTETFSTVRDNQTEICFKVLQGESMVAGNNLLLGEIRIEVPKNKAGEESIEVTYTYDVNALLEVEVLVPSTGKKYRKVIRGRDTDLTDEEIEQRFQELSYLKIPPRKQEANKLVLLRADRIYAESLGADRLILENAVNRFRQALNSQDLSLIEKERAELTAFLDRMENMD